MQGDLLKGAASLRGSERQIRDGIVRNHKSGETCLPKFRKCFLLCYQIVGEISDPCTVDQMRRLRSRGKMYRKLKRQGGTEARKQGQSPGVGCRRTKRGGNFSELELAA
jgi:hypothetical protein